MKLKLTLLFSLLLTTTFAQTKIVGLVKDTDKNPIPGVKVKIIGDNEKAFTDIHGAFEVYTDKKFPITLDISCTGYNFEKLVVESEKQEITVTLTAEDPRLNEIVVAASRNPEKIKESPVTIERLSIKDIRKMPAINFYDGIENIKEVQMNSSSLGFKSINTRGFANAGNLRFLQLVDGVDNSSVSLNFVFANILGVSEIDIQNVELLPGPSSALYGANAFNGILFMNSQNPFLLQGITAYLKYGSTNQVAAGNNVYYDYGIRVAKAFSKHFAAKTNFTFMKGTEWYATNYGDVKDPSLTRTDKNYDGVNVYGDEVSTDIYAVGRKITAANPAFATLLPTLANQGNVSRTGYNEVDLTDNIAINAKMDFSLHFKPWANDVEIIWQSKFGLGNAVYQGSNRYNLNNFFMQQHLLEVRGKNFFVRGHHNSEDAVSSYDMKFAGININRDWKTDSQWFTDYAVRYAQGFAGLLGSAYQGNESASQANARAYADTGRLIPGTTAFETAFKKIIGEPNVQKGAKLVDNCSVNHLDANYNLKDLVSFAEIQIGGSFIKHNLDSKGRIYTDTNGPIIYSEQGFYGQAQKKMIDDKLKITASIRYDKSDNYQGNYSPRFSAVYAAGDKQNHIFRASMQTGFRNPSTQEQYIGINVGSAILLGTSSDNMDRYSETLPISVAGQPFAGATSVSINGNNAINNSYTASSAAAFGTSVTAAAPTNATQLAAAINSSSSLLTKSTANLVVPEVVKSFDIGYRTKTQGIVLDVNGYFNIYNNFIGSKYVVTPLYGIATDGGNFAPSTPAFQSAMALINDDKRVFGIYTNTNIEIQSYGAGVGLSKKLTSNYEFGLNYNFADFDFNQSQDPTFAAGFNTPKHRVKASLLGEKVLANFGFNINYRWADSYLYESNFANGMIAATSVIDAQINYNFTKIKSTLKIGGTNLGGKEYFTVYGAGGIGQQYYVNWTINP